MKYQCFPFKAAEASVASLVFLMSLTKVFSIGVFLKLCDLCMFEERVILTLLVGRMMRSDIFFQIELSKCF